MSIQQLNMRDGYGFFVKSNYQTQLHKHYPIEAVYCQDGFFDIHTKHGHYTNIKAVLIPSNLPHRFRCTDAKCELLFVDPLSGLGRLINEEYQLASQEVIVHPQQIETLFDKPLFSGAHAKKLGKQKPEKEIDSRIDHCLEAIRANLYVADLTIQQLSRISYLSESRLSHLFKEQTGIPIRQYILWEKICLAVSKAITGQSLTACAHYAGFYDSAHFHKVFSNMFGVNPFLGLKS